MHSTVADGYFFRLLHYFKVNPYSTRWIVRDSNFKVF